VEVPTTAKGVNVAQDDEVKTRAEAIRARLKAGEPFPRLAADFSAAPSRANGGLIGPLRLDELAPAFQKVLEPMKVGDVTEPIRTTRGYQLLKLESRTETRVRGFADARNDIGERVAETKRQGELQKYLDRLRSQATVTWRNDELKRAYDVALAKRQAAASTATPPSAPAPYRRRGPRWSQPTALPRQTLPTGLPSGRARGTSRPFAVSWNRGRLSRSCRPSRSGPDGRTGESGSTGRCFQATASPGSRRAPVSTC